MVSDKCGLSKIKVPVKCNMTLKTKMYSICIER